MLSKQITSGILTYEISDHLPTFCIIPIKVDIVEQTKTFRCAKNFNVDDYVMNVENLVSDTFIDCCSNNGNAELAFNNFIDGFSNIINHHMPIKAAPQKRRKTNHKPWLTKGILNSIKTKNKLFRKSYKQNNVQLTTFYKKYSNKLTTVKRTAKQQYYQSQLSIFRKNTTKTWGIIKQILGKRNHNSQPSISKLITQTDDAITDKGKISNELNVLFTDVGLSLAAKIPAVTKAYVNNNSIRSQTNSIFFYPVTPKEVEKQF